MEGQKKNGSDESMKFNGLMDFTYFANAFKLRIIIAHTDVWKDTESHVIC